MNHKVDATAATALASPSSSSRNSSPYIVTITKPTRRFYFRRGVTVFILGALVVVPLLREGRILYLQQADTLRRYNHDNHYQSSSSIDPVQKVSLSSSSSSFITTHPSQVVPNQENGNHHNITPQYVDMPTVLHFPAKDDDGIEMLMELDGLKGSKAFHLVNDVNASMLHPNLIWIGSPIPRRFCNIPWVQQAMEFYRQKLHPPDVWTPKADWTFHLLDWGDNPQFHLRCRRLERMVGKSKIHYWKRSIVRERQWNNLTNTVEKGRLPKFINDVRVHPLHLSTRTDIVQAIADIATANQSKHMTASEISDYVVTKDRPGDVVHHWPAFGRGVNRGASRHQPVRNDLLRSLTSLTLANMTQPPYHLGDVFCGMQGVAKDKGRSSTSNTYVDSLLHYKIMVVSQRDMFEGHLRLFEGLVSGALVIHDRIVSQPVGLQENVNIVFFDNQEELKQKVMYYLTHKKERLAIARQGRKLAMCQSRTWHRMEQIILGRTVTPCGE